MTPRRWAPYRAPVTLRGRPLQRPSSRELSHGSRRAAHATRGFTRRRQDCTCRSRACTSRPRLSLRIEPANTVQAQMLAAHGGCHPAPAPTSSRCLAARGVASLDQTRRPHPALRLPYLGSGSPPPTHERFGRLSSRRRIGQHPTQLRCGGSAWRPTHRPLSLQQQTRGPARPPRAAATNPCGGHQAQSRRRVSPSPPGGI